VRAQRDAELLALITASHARSDATYGAPRVHEDLAEAGHRVGRKRVARLMRAAGLVGVSKTGAAPRPKRATPESPQAPDLVKRDFTATAPNELWVADITYVPTYAGFLYLAVVLDAFSRRAVGWAMSNTLKASVVLDALQMAATQRRPSNVIHHSDQGSQYSALAFGQRCKALGVRPSMGSPGAASRHTPRRASRSSATSKAGTTRIAATRPSGSARPSPSSAPTPPSQRSAPPPPPRLEAQAGIAPLNRGNST
jgi:putative transposase